MITVPAAAAGSTRSAAAGGEKLEWVLALDIGGTKYRAALMDRCGVLAAVRRGETQREAGPEWMVRQLTVLARDMLAAHPGHLRAFGIGFGGPVDFGAQRILRSMHARRWADYPLLEFLQQEFAVPGVVDNDGNLGALGEAVRGAGQDRRSFLYMTVSTGVGGGIYQDGAIVRGSHGLAGEIGHLPLDSAGPRCSCGGQGCLEAYCSGLSVARQFQERFGVARSAKAIFAMADHDSHVGAFLEEVKDRLAQGIAAAVNLLDVEAVVIGGGLAQSPRLFEGLTERVAQRLLLSELRAVPCLPASLGDDSVLVGAGALAWDHCERGIHG